MNLAFIIALHMATVINVVHNPDLINALLFYILTWVSFLYVYKDTQCAVLVRSFYTQEPGLRGMVDFQKAEVEYQEEEEEEEEDEEEEDEEGDEGDEAGGGEERDEAGDGEEREEAGDGEKGEDSKKSEDGEAQEKEKNEKGSPQEEIGS